MKKLSILGILATSLLVFAGCSADSGQEDSTASESVEVTTETTAKETTETSEVLSGASSTDATTSASIVPDELVETYEPKGFSDDADKEKALFVVADPRAYSVTNDLANTAMAYFESKDVEVEKRDLYEIGFNPVLSEETFYNAKDGAGETPEDVKTEQEFVTQADHIIFVYPNWHDTPTAIVKGYMERVFAKQYAYKDSDSGLEGLLTDKDIYTIMNCGYLGGGRGFIGDGVGQNDETWDKYMEAFKVFDDDTAGFWGVTNKGRFMNDQTPSNDSDNYAEELETLRDDLRTHLDKDFFK